MKKILTLFYILILSSPAFGTTYNFTDTVNHGLDGEMAPTRIIGTPSDIPSFQVDHTPSMMPPAD